MKPEAIKWGHWVKYNCYFVLQHFLGYKLYKQYFGKGSQNLFNKIKLDIKSTSPDNSAKVPELPNEAVDQNLLKNHQQLLKKPILFKGAAKDWVCTSKWNLEFFENEFGDIKVPLVDTVGAIDPNNPQEFEEIPLRDYINQLRNGSLKYLKFSSLVQDKMKLQEDFNLDWLRKFKPSGSFGDRFYMFMGGKGTITPLHNEFSSVVYVQVFGKKKWILYESKDRIYLDARTERKHYFYSTADPLKSNNDQHPLMNYGVKYEVTLEPGDVLWFPIFAWHHVENLTDSIGVAYKFNNVLDSFKTSKMLTTLYFLSTNPNIFVNAIAMRFSKKHFDTKSTKRK